MRRILFAVLGVLMLAGSSVRAHHSYAGFFDPKDRTIAIEGDLESLPYANPHTVMKIRATDSTIYTVTWQAAIVARAQRWRDEVDIQRRRPSDRRWSAITGSGVA